MTAAEIIKEIRSKLHLSQEELARSIFASYHTANRWENNKSTPNRMARALLIDFCQKQGINQEFIDAIGKIR